MYGKDSPQKLVELVLDEMKNSDNDINAILMNGDLVAHGNAIDDENPSHEELKNAWQKMKITL